MNIFMQCFVNKCLIPLYCCENCLAIRQKRVTVKLWSGFRKVVLFNMNLIIVAGAPLLFLILPIVGISIFSFGHYNGS